MFPSYIQNAIQAFARLPGIGVRQATRLVFYLLKENNENTDIFLQSIRAIKEKIHTCVLCFLYFEPITEEQKICAICANPKRLKTMICVIEKEIDVEVIEKMNTFQGVYHVVGEAVDTLDIQKAIPVMRLIERITYIKNQLPPPSIS